MEGHAGADQLTASTADDPLGVGTDRIDTGVPVEDPERRPSRLDRGRLAGICGLVMLLGVGLAAGGYFALRSHRESQGIARANEAAIAAARECVAATQAPDAAALAAAQQKILECSTGDFAAQATLYNTMLVQAYQASQARVQVSEMRSAVERDNDDGTVDLLVALRVQVDSAAVQGREFGYRLRVKMAPADGQYKIAKLDQVTK